MLKTVDKEDIEGLHCPVLCWYSAHLPSTDVTSVSRIHIKVPGVVHVSAIPEMGRWRQADPI